MPMAMPWRVRLKGLPAAALLTSREPYLLSPQDYRAYCALTGPGPAQSPGWASWLTNSPAPSTTDTAAGLEEGVRRTGRHRVNDPLRPNGLEPGEATFHRQPLWQRDSSAACSRPICLVRPESVHLSQRGPMPGMKVIPWFEYGLMERPICEVVALVLRK